jgi:hypothetical protein
MAGRNVAEGERVRSNRKRVRSAARAEREGGKDGTYLAWHRGRLWNLCEGS